MSSGSLCPIVPLELHHGLFDLLHSSSHPRICASCRFLSFSLFFLVCPGTDLWALACLCCQWSKIHTHVHASVPAILVPSRQFFHIHLDLVGPLPSSHGFTYLLTMIDRTTCWPEVARLSSITAESCVTAFLFSWVARFGVLFSHPMVKHNSPPPSGPESAVSWEFLCLLLIVFTLRVTV